MQKLQLPHIILPSEFVALLKTNIAITTSSAPVFDPLRNNRAIYCVLEKSFKEFDDGRGLEKTMMALGWPNFRERMASIYVYKAIFDNFPNKTSMELVEDIKAVELRFLNHGVHSLSRLFLLGFYLKMANLEMQKRQNNKFIEIVISKELDSILEITPGRSEKIDWVILITMHLLHGLGEKMLMNAMVSGKKFEDLYNLLSPDLRENMMNNLLAYGASIQEQEVFLYEKI